MEDRFKLAMGQMLVEGGQVQGNLQRAIRFMHDAARQDCRIIVLPECLDLGWAHPVARELAQPIPGRYSDALCAAAQASGVYVVAGLNERAGDRFYNAAILISPGGEILLKHRKINELSFARDIYSIGDRLGVVHTALGATGVNICADNFPQTLHLARSQAGMGAEILLSPCAWAVDAEHDNRQEPYGGLWRESYTALAGEHTMTVVGVSNVGWINGGVWKGRKCIGCSLAMGPGGVILAQAPYGESAESLMIVTVEIARSRDVPSMAAQPADCNLVFATKP